MFPPLRVSSGKTTIRVARHVSGVIASAAKVHRFFRLVPGLAGGQNIHLPPIRENDDAGQNHE